VGLIWEIWVKQITSRHRGSGKVGGWPEEERKRRKKGTGSYRGRENLSMDWARRGGGPLADRKHGLGTTTRRKQKRKIVIFVLEEGKTTPHENQPFKGSAKEKKMGNLDHRLGGGAVSRAH